jgi:hypothetical protein
LFFLFFYEAVIIKRQAPFNVLRIAAARLKASAAARCKSIDALAIAQEVKGKLNSLV